MGTALIPDQPPSCRLHFCLPTNTCTSPTSTTQLLSLIQPQSSSPFNQFHHQHHQSSSNNPSLWLVPSKPLASPLVARPQESSSPPRPLASLHHPPEVSRSLTDTSLVPSLSVRSVATRSPPSSRSESFPSSVWSVKSPKTSSPTFASSPLPSVLFKSPLRPTSSPWRTILDDDMTSQLANNTSVIMTLHTIGKLGCTNVLMGGFMSCTGETE